MPFLAKRYFEGLMAMPALIADEKLLLNPDSKKRILLSA